MRSTSNGLHRQIAAQSLHGSELTTLKVMLIAALASVLITSCYDGDTCTTMTGEKVRLACIDTPELSGKKAEPVPAKAARDHLRGLVLGKKVGIRRITEDC